MQQPWAEFPERRYPTFSVVDAINRRAVRRPPCACLTPLLQTRRVRQVASRKPLRRDVAHQHHADAVTAEAVRRVPRVSAAADRCFADFFPLVCRNVSNNLLEGDVGAIVRELQWSGARYTCPPLWSLRLLFTASPAFHQRQPEHASVGAHAQPPTHRAKPHAQKHARTRTSTSCQPFLSPFSPVCSGIATVACSLALFPQQGKCVDNAERVGQDQATSNFGRCGRLVRR